MIAYKMSFGKVPQLRSVDLANRVQCKGIDIRTKYDIKHNHSARIRFRTQ